MNWGEVVERRIPEAQERGEFDDLPGKGKPLDLTESPFADPDPKISVDEEKLRVDIEDW